MFSRATSNVGYRHDAGSHRRRSALTKSIGVAAALLFLAWAAFYFVTALVAIKNFAWRQPMFDQWRMYQSLLTLPFPRNVISLENGHRPIIPNLIRYMEVNWFAANQLIQIIVGIACAAASATTIAYVGWRERSISFASRSAAVMLAILGIFWLANARMLMHGNEALQVYLAILSVICATLLTRRAAYSVSNGWLVAASIACTVAMYCFGSGVASFPAVIVLGILLRIPLRRLAIPATALVVSLAVYLFVLPGDEGVRRMLAIQPWASTKVAMTWMAAPWATGWLALADPPLYPQIAKSFEQDVVGAMLVASANTIVTTLHISWRTLSMLIGFLGASLFAIRTSLTFMRRETLTLLRSLATMLCLFALATAFVIGIGRLDYFANFNDQVFADRYLLWPCLFWCGFALILLLDLSALKSRWPVVVYFAFLLCLPAALLPMHSNSAGWSAAVYQNAQRMAAAAESGVIEARVATINADTVEEYTRTVELLKERNLAMFANSVSRLLDQQWTAPIDRDPDLAATAAWAGTFDSANGRARRLEGVVQHGIGKLRDDGKLALLDDTDRIAGFAEFSSIGRGKNSLLWTTPRKRGFDGYVANDDTHAHYRLVWLNPKTQRGLLLADLPGN